MVRGHGLAAAAYNLLQPTFLSVPILTAAVLPLSHHWQCLDLRGRSGSEIFAALFASDAIATLLESPGQVDGAPASLIRYSICAGMPRRQGQRDLIYCPPVGQILPTLQQLLAQGITQPQWAQDSPQIPPADLPFRGGWLGWLGFDTAWEIEQLPYLRDDPLPFPVAYWYEPERFAVIDHQQQQIWLAAPSTEALATMAEQLSHPVPPSSAPPKPGAGPSPVRLYSDQTSFEAAVQRAKQHIRAGDVFQVNLSLRFQTQTAYSPWQLYCQLHHINPSPFASYWRTPWGYIVSCSPERLVQLQGQRVQTRPIAGTRPRGSSALQDRQLATTLQSNAKENAEHIMLVDLERNDLGRVCQWGTVEVDELMVIERYSHVMHLVSNVVGQLLPARNAVDLMRATFPGGTITGCPKVRCMEIIESLEPVRRSLFYGSCGYLDSRGSLDLNILIRTLLMAPSPSPNGPPATHYDVWGQVGAGIVADSDPHQEWLESLQKAKAQLLALD